MHAGDVTFSVEADLGKLKRDLDNAFKNIQSFAGKAEGALFLQAGTRFDGSKLNKELKQQVSAIEKSSPTISPKIDTRKLNAIKNELNSIQVSVPSGPTGPMGGETSLLNNIKKINDLLSGKSESISKVKDTQVKETLAEPFSKEKIGKLIGMALSEQLNSLKPKLPASNKLLSENQKEAVKIVNEPISIDSIKRITELALRDEIAKFKPQINPNSNIPLSTQKDAINIINQPMSLEKIKQMVELALKDQVRFFEESKPIQPKVNIPTPDPINIPTPKIEQPITTRVIKIETGPMLRQLDDMEKTMQLEPIIPSIDLKNIKAELDTLKEIKIDSQVSIPPIAPIKIPSPNLLVDEIKTPIIDIPDPKIELPKIPDPIKINIPNVEVGKIKLPVIPPINLESPQINLPNIGQPIIDIPKPKLNIPAPASIKLPIPKIEPLELPQINIEKELGKINLAPTISPKIETKIELPKIELPQPDPIKLPSPIIDPVKKVELPIWTKIETGVIKKQIEEIESISNPPIITPQIDTSKIQAQLAVLQNIPISPKIDASAVAQEQLKVSLSIPQEAEKSLIDKVRQINEILFNPSAEQIKKFNNPDLAKTLEQPFSGEKIKKILGMAVENEIKKFKIEPSKTLPEQTKQQATEIINQPISVDAIKKLTELAIRQEVDKIQIKRTDKPIPLEVNDFLVKPDLENTKKVIDLAIGEEIEKIKPKITALADIISQVKPFAGELLMSPPAPPPASPAPPGPTGPIQLGRINQKHNAPIKDTKQPILGDIEGIGLGKWDVIGDIQKFLGLKKEIEKETVKVREITGDNIIDLTKDFEGGAKKLAELMNSDQPKLLPDPKLLSGEKNIEKKINISVDEAKKKQAIDAVKNIKVNPPKIDLSPTKEAGKKINSVIEQSSVATEDAINKTQKNTAKNRERLIEDLFKIERDLAIENILDVEAQKLDSLKRIANENDLLGDENKRQQSLQGISAEVKILMPLEKAKSDLEYKLQIASLSENEVTSEQLKQQILKQNLKITEAKYRADSEALQLQIEGKNIALDTAKIQAQMALAETEANLNRAFANGEKIRTITALQRELEYRQKLVDSATANISNTQKINELEKKKLLLTSQSTKESLKQTREIEKLKQAKDKANKDNKLNKQATNSQLKSPKVRLIEQEQLSLDLVKKKFDLGTKYLEALKDIGDRSIDLFEATTNPQLVLDVLNKQYELQEKINKSKLDAIKEEIKLNQHNLEIERAKDVSAMNRDEAESRQEILRAKQTILRAERSGDQISIAGAKNELAIATENLSVVLQEREYADQIYIHKKQQLGIEGKSSLLMEKMSQRAGLIASYQNKINSAGKVFNNILEQQQKNLQSIGDLNKTIFDARVNALSQESSLLDNAISLRDRLNSDEEKPKTLVDEMNKQLRVVAGSSGVSEKKLLMDRLKIEEQMAKEKMLALKAEQSMQKSLLEIELNKQRIQAEMAVMQAKLMAMSLKGTPMEGEGQALITDAVKNQINVENLAKNALDSLGIKQAMEQYNQGMDNFRNINQQRLNVAERGYVPQGELPRLPKQYDVPRLKNEPQYQPVRIQDTLLKDVVNLIDQKRDESLLSNIESIASQILDKLDVLPQGGNSKSDNNIPSMASSGSSNNSNLPTPPVVNNYGGLTFISSDPTGDARKVLNDLAKANKNK